MIWILVADEAKARFFSADKPVSPLIEIKVIESPEGSMLDQQIVSDKPGRGSTHFDQGKHAVGKKSVHKEQYATQFAKEVNEYLIKNLHTKAFGRLIVVSAPHFLGLLRKEFSKGVTGTISFQLDRDLTMMAPKEIREHLPKFL